MAPLDWKSILKGALVAAVGAALTALLQYVGGLDFGPFTPAVVAGLSVLANILRKYLGILPVVLLCCCLPTLHAQEPRPVATLPAGTWSAIDCPDATLAFDVPAELRQWYRNPDGSCVQCSIGMVGVDQNVPAAATLLWNTDYGRKERGGSYPSRVAEYSKRRGIKIYNVTGSQTFEWMKWACKNGRGAAIGAGAAHFQTLVGYNPKLSTWYVCNNNSPQRIDEYTEEGFRRLHLASGPWIVVLDYPPHPARPEYFHWWR